MKRTSFPWVCKGQAIVSETENTGHDSPDEVEAYEGHVICESVAPQNRALITNCPQMFEVLKTISNHETSLGVIFLKKWAESIIKAIIENETMVNTPSPWIGNGASIVSKTEKTGHDDEESVKVCKGHLVCESVMFHNRPIITQAPDMLELLILFYKIGNYDNFFVFKSWAGHIVRLIEAQENDIESEIENEKFKIKGLQYSLDKLIQKEKKGE